MMNDLILRSLLPPNSCFMLDLENQGFNAQLEAIVDRAAKYPLSTKIAFANFSNRSKVSAELHRRMYSMVHVPKVTNAADAQMITTGCLLFLNNPQTKEVFICSNDQIFSFLQKTLVHLGKQVHMVTRTGKSFYIDGVLVADFVVTLPDPVPINTITELTKSVMKLIVQLLKQENAHAIKINILGSKFAQIYGNGINYFLTQFKLGIKFIDFLKLNPELTIIKQGQEYYVCLSQVYAKA
jgi:NYN domain